MPAVPWWAVFSAAALPMLLVIGWTTATVRQPPGYDPWADTVSSLSSYGMLDRQILVGCLAGLGVAHLVTAVGLRPVRSGARTLYGIGGAATILVAAVPKTDSQTPPVHGIAAVVAFVALAAWPAVATLPVPRRDRNGHRQGPPRHDRRGWAAPRRSPVDQAADRSGRHQGHGIRGEPPARARPARQAARPWVLRPAAGGAASLVMLGFGLWLALQLPDGDWAGLAERLIAGTEAVWPLVVVLTLFRRARRRPGTAPG
ncbi:DUF998 domain-containing protein [Plantactinospora sp. KLBMP9567]|uniref:DUF998 domain-containing protein n=1 Tax=Plantactinospora sp. KLBMP9567 TaxID=3085900 RepID=UPI002981A5A6|nr:DUF998 domain-containing protein [Plantactinospora sp. KLBMP9567]MDW5326084.1 DUF998 domain-containing protein [Plantactinospora sp. KLBMP9567]